MPQIDSQIFKNNFSKKTLTIVLEEGDQVNVSIKRAMVENNISEAKITDVSGVLQSGVIQFMEGVNIRNKDLVDVDLLHASGTLKVSYNELYGTIKISTKSKPPYSGTLLGGKANEGLTFKMSFLEEKKN